MSDRKYRQRGYQDDGSRPRGAAPRKLIEPHDPRIPRDPRTPNMPVFREAFRCGRCGQTAPTPLEPDGVCSRCGVAHHACINCEFFDSSARFECRERVPARISPKDTKNACQLFSPRVTIERDTGSTPASSSSSARKAFDDLFKI